MLQCVLRKLLLVLLLALCVFYKLCHVTVQVLDSEADHDLIYPDAAPADIDDLFDELDDLSDSGPELDTLSVMSTPKPRLRWVLEHLVTSWGHLLGFRGWDTAQWKNVWPLCSWSLWWSHLRSQM